MTPSSLPILDTLIIPFLFKLVGAVALWIAGGWCIRLATKLLRRSLVHSHLEPTVTTYLINIVGAVLRVAGQPRAVVSHKLHCYD